MYPATNSLSIRLTEPVVPLRITPQRTSRHHDSEMLPPAVVRGLLVLKLAKPTKISSIELELQAKATTHYKQCAGPSRVDVDTTEKYKVHSASVVVFKADSEWRRAACMRSRLNGHFGTRLSGTGSGWQVPQDPVTGFDRRRLSSGELEIDHDRCPGRSQFSLDPAPPYPDPDHPFDTSLAGRSQSIARSSSSRTTESPTSPVSPGSSLISDIPYGSSAFNAHSTTDIALSSTSSIDEAPEDESECFNASTACPDSIGYYGLSCIATSSVSRSSERNHRGRSHSRFSFEKVVHAIEAVKDRMRSRSPSAVFRSCSDDRQERGRSLTKGRVQTQIRNHVMPQTEVAATDAATDQSGDGWVMFSEGTYTYPVFFTIPNNSPPTIKADHGSLIWKVRAEVRRPGAFNFKMTTEKEVIVVCTPMNDASWEIEGIDLQQQWEGQLLYRVQIPRRGFPIGGKVPLQLTITPSTKVKVHSILAHLDERTEYYTRAQTWARSGFMRRVNLLAIKHSNSNERHSKPILPLKSDEPDAFRQSPLYHFLGPGEGESEAASSFMGPGPWTIRHQLKLPDSCSNLHPSNQTKRSNIMVDHTLKLALRVEKEEGTSSTGKMYDIVIQIPLQIMSCHCTSEWSILPHYDEALRSDSRSLEDISMCPCRTHRGEEARTHPQVTDILPSGRAHSAPLGVVDIFGSNSLADCSRLHERLISGLVSERGESPPLYERFQAIAV